MDRVVFKLSSHGLLRRVDVAHHRFWGKLAKDLHMVGFLVCYDKSVWNLLDFSNYWFKLGSAIVLYASVTKLFSNFEILSLYKEFFIRWKVWFDVTSLLNTHYHSLASLYRSYRWFILRDRSLLAIVMLVTYRMILIESTCSLLNWTLGPFLRVTREDRHQLSLLFLLLVPILRGVIWHRVKVLYIVLLMCFRLFLL
jgi:hypothetical protein